MAFKKSIRFELCNIVSKHINDILSFLVSAVRNSISQCCMQFSMLYVRGLIIKTIDYLVSIYVLRLYKIKKNVI